MAINWNTLQPIQTKPVDLGSVLGGISERNYRDTASAATQQQMDFDEQMGPLKLEAAQQELAMGKQKLFDQQTESALGAANRLSAITAVMEATPDGEKSRKWAEIYDTYERMGTNPGKLGFTKNWDENNQRRLYVLGTMATKSLVPGKFSDLTPQQKEAVGKKQGIPSEPTAAETKDAARVRSLSDQRTIINTNIDLLNKTLSETPSWRRGPIAGRVTGAIPDVVGDDGQAKGQEAEALANTLALQIRSSLKMIGSMSDADRDFLVASVASLKTNPTAAPKILENLKEMFNSAVESELTASGGAPLKPSLVPMYKAPSGTTYKQSDIDAVSQKSGLPAEQIIKDLKLQQTSMRDKSDVIQLVSQNLSEIQTQGTDAGFGSVTTPYKAAQKMVGLSEHEDNRVLASFFKKSLGKNIDPAETPWCAAFVNAVLNSNGGKGTGSLMARSYLEWGTPTKTPKEGDIVVLQRTGDPTKGHVGFYAGEASNGRIKVLGGNQGDSVSVKAFPKAMVLGYRQAPKVDEIKTALAENNVDVDTTPREPFSPESSRMPNVSPPDTGRSYMPIYNDTQVPASSQFVNRATPPALSVPKMRSVLASMKR